MGKGKGMSDMSEWNYGRWALNLRSLRADLLQVLLWSWLNSWLLTRPTAMLSGRLPSQSATLPINVHIVYRHNRFTLLSSSIANVPVLAFPSMIPR